MSTLATSFTQGVIQYTQVNRIGNYAIFSKWKPGIPMDRPTYDIIQVVVDASGNETYPTSVNLGSHLVNTFSQKDATRLLNNAVKYNQLGSQLFF